MIDFWPFKVISEVLGARVLSGHCLSVNLDILHLPLSQRRSLLHKSLILLMLLKGLLIVELLLVLCFLSQFFLVLFEGSLYRLIRLAKLQGSQHVDVSLMKELIVLLFYQILNFLFFFCLLD